MDASALSALKTYTSARKVLGEGAGLQNNTAASGQNTVKRGADGLPSLPSISASSTGGIDSTAEVAAHPVTQGAQKFVEVFRTAEATAANFTVGQADAQAVVEALAGAEVALETAVTVRNRVVEAYQEILRMPV